MKPTILIVLLWVLIGLIWRWTLTPRIVPYAITDFPPLTGIQIAKYKPFCWRIEIRSVDDEKGFIPVMEWGICRDIF